PEQLPSPSVAFPLQPVALDLLVEIRPRHVQNACSLRYVPVVLAQLCEEKGPFGGTLEFLEGLALQERAQAASLRRASSNLPFHVRRRDGRTARENEQSFDRVPQLAHVARPVQ